MDCTAKILRSLHQWCVIVALITATQGAVHPIASDNSNLHCSAHFNLHNSHCYRYFGLKTKRAYFHAQRQCHRLQSTLVTIHSSQEDQFIVALTEANSSFWIGLNDHDGPEREHCEGVFKWDTGEELNGYAHWGAGEPANKQHLDCVKADATGWSMASGGCASTKLPYVCKKLACPEGLDLYNGLCDIILSQQSHWLLSNSLHHLAVLLLLFLSVFLSCVLVCVRLRSKTQDPVTDKLPNVIKPTLRTPLAIEELYPT